MHRAPVMVVTGTRKGIGQYLVEHYTKKGYMVIGCSRGEVAHETPNYRHFALDVSDEAGVSKLFSILRKEYGRIDVLINNAGTAAMNHSLLTPLKTLNNIYNTNVFGTFLFCREAAKLMQTRKFGRIVNFATVAVPLKLAGEAAYASSKAAVISLTQILAKEFADFGITVNAIGPVPVNTDLIRNVPEKKILGLIGHQAIHRFGEYKDISNVIDFFIQPASDFITGQVIYLGGI